jgi:hypothetical protein
MALVFYILFIIFNVFLYWIPLCLIYKRRDYSAISVRSPTLLIISNLGGFFMTTSYICYEMIEYLNDVEIKLTLGDFDLFCRIVPNNFFIFHFLLIFSFILRCQRIIQCCRINYDERTDIKEFYDRRYLYKESFYIKILFASTVIVTFITLLLNLALNDFMIIPPHFKTCLPHSVSLPYVSLVWLLISFVEHVAVFTYTYFLTINFIKQMIKFELISFLAIWVFYPNTMRIIELFTTDSPHWISYLSIVFLYMCLFVNSYLPLYITFKDKESISYHFNPKLASNLYTYLSNETCYHAFVEYLKNTNDCDESLFYLNFYIALLKYKLLHSVELNYAKLVSEAKEIYFKYFSTSSYEKYLDSEILNRIRNACNHCLDKDDIIDYSMYDEALVYAFDYLNRIFKKYKKSEEYQILIDNLNIDSYIQCKMSNTGLINKF